MISMRVSLKKALGIWWNTKTDCFMLSIPKTVLNAHDPGTKQSLLSIASKVFDLMGLIMITPFTIRLKILFQELWERGLLWEDQLDEDIAGQWRFWKSELSEKTMD